MSVGKYLSEVLNSNKRLMSRMSQWMCSESTKTIRRTSTDFFIVSLLNIFIKNSVKYKFYAAKLDKVSRNGLLASTHGLPY